MTSLAERQATLRVFTDQLARQLHRMWREGDTRQAAVAEAERRHLALADVNRLDRLPISNRWALNWLRWLCCRWARQDVTRYWGQGSCQRYSWGAGVCPGQQGDEPK